MAYTPFLLFIASAIAQQIGTNTPEVHPSLPSERCTIAGGCKPANTSIVIDANFRWLHNVGGYTNCVVNDVFNKTICTDAESCTKACAVEGVDYPGMGLKTTGNAVTMNLFVTKDGKIQKSSPRIYLYDEAVEGYAKFSLLNKEFAFDVDTSKAGCGVNGALYLSEMSLNGHKDATNVAGAKYGVGYCDAQCPKQNWLMGRVSFGTSNGANFAGKGSCCNEMDIWEANSAAMTYTPHPCNVTGPYACSEPDCGNAPGGKNKLRSVCDKDGCEINAYRNGVQSFYGKGKTIDSAKPFTVVTQFVTVDNKDSGALKEIRRLYVQDGKVHQEAKATAKGLEDVNSMTDGYCAKQKSLFGGGASAPNTFATQGGLKTMGEAVGRGMVLAMAIWDDAGGSMHWMDSTIPENAAPGTPGAARGPCPVTGGKPAQILAEQPNAQVTFSKIRSGEIGSTYKA
ncbi:glycoside hydrolase [Microthyrium microscopicum]|uniref:Glucanase n=1 Tax=Microthyrium microscopicum TaxID=703497 RepID=A0A6A6UDV7_9PEZI|nr:glycoside hydrolase [Microthyrium microscopicum]